MCDGDGEAAALETSAHVSEEFMQALATIERQAIDLGTLHERIERYEKLFNDLNNQLQILMAEKAEADEALERVCRLALVTREDLTKAINRATEERRTTEQVLEENARLRMDLDDVRRQRMDRP